MENSLTVVSFPRAGRKAYMLHEYTSSDLYYCVHFLSSLHSAVNAVNGQESASTLFHFAVLLSEMKETTPFVPASNTSEPEQDIPIDPYQYRTPVWTALDMVLETTEGVQGFDMKERAEWLLKQVRLYVQWTDVLEPIIQALEKATNGCPGLCFSDGNPSGNISVIIDNSTTGRGAGNVLKALLPRMQKALEELLAEQAKVSLG